MPWNQSGLYMALHCHSVHAHLQSCLHVAMTQQLCHARCIVLPPAGDRIRHLLLEPGGTLEPVDLVTTVLGGRDELQQIHGGWCPQTDGLVASLTAEQ